MTASEWDNGPWLVDSCGWLDYFADTPRADRYAPLLEHTGTDNLLTTPIVLFEVYRRLHHLGFGESSPISLQHMRNRCFSVELTDELALTAAAISLEERLAMADSLVLAAARSVGATLVTSDADLRGKAGVKFVE